MTRQRGVTRQNAGCPKVVSQDWRQAPLLEVPLSIQEGRNDVPAHSECTASSMNYSGAADIGPLTCQRDVACQNAGCQSGLAAGVDAADAAERPAEQE